MTDTFPDLVDEQLTAYLFEIREDILAHYAQHGATVAERRHLDAEARAEESRQFMGAIQRRFTFIGDPELMELAARMLDHAEQLHAYHLEALFRSFAPATA